MHADTSKMQYSCWCLKPSSRYDLIDFCSTNKGRFRHCIKTGDSLNRHPWVNIPTTAPWCETHFLAHFEIQMFLNQPFSLCSSCTKPTGAAVNPKMVKVSTFSYHSEKGKKPEWMFLSQNQNGCFFLLLWSGFFMKQVWNTWGFSMLLSNSSQTCHVRAQRLHRKKKYLDRLPCKGCFALEKLLSGN